MLTKELKYIIVRDADMNDEYPIVFPKELIHAAVGRCHRIGSLTVVSAGFCQLSDAGVVAYGHSESLDKSSRPQDAAIIQLSLCKEDAAV